MPAGTCDLCGAEVGFSGVALLEEYRVEGVEVLCSDCHRDANKIIWLYAEKVRRFERALRIRAWRQWVAAKLAARRG